MVRRIASLSHYVSHGTSLMLISTQRRHETNWCVLDPVNSVLVQRLRGAVSATRQTDDSILRPRVHNSVAPPAESRWIGHVADSKPASVHGPLCENTTTSSATPDVNNLLHNRAADTGNTHGKFREVRTRDFLDMRAERQTDRHADRNTSHAFRGRSKDCRATSFRLSNQRRRKHEHNKVRCEHRRHDNGWRSSLPCLMPLISCRRLGVRIVVRPHAERVERRRVTSVHTSTCT